MEPGSGLDCSDVLTLGGLHFQFVMGLPGQVIPAIPKNLIHLVESARQTDPDCTFSACAVGRAQFPIITVAAMLGLG